MSKSRLEKEIDDLKKQLKKQLKKSRIDHFNQRAREAERVIKFGIFENLLDSDFLKELEDKKIIAQSYGFRLSAEIGISLAVDGILRGEND